MRPTDGIEFEGTEVRVSRDPLDGFINIIIYTDSLDAEFEHNESRIPKLRVLVNEEDEGIRINSNGMWVGEHVASPLEQLAEAGE